MHRALFVAAALLGALPVAAAPATVGAANARYIVNDRVRIRTRDGATLSAILVRRADAPRRQPAALVFTIYADPPADTKNLEYAADRGYAAVIAYTRGKAYSPQHPVPYEYDGRDADDVISWIAKQAWSNGAVGMYGGSYNGFTQWAAAKYANPALKTIVPYVPNNPGNGLPLQNSVFLLVNYAWIYYVTDNKFLDAAAYAQPRWGTLNERWYLSGRPYQDVDAIAGIPNPWLHKWLAHPGYDAYWQRMSPYRSDYARIAIPVLTISGYYGDSTAIGYIDDFLQFNHDARSYLVIGPWDHLGTQRRVKPAVLRGYRIDSVAHIDTPKLTFDWLDYVMRGKPRPALVADRVNYEVMGENVWRHARSFAAMGAPARYYITNRRVSKRFFALTTTQPKDVAALDQRVDLADRRTSNNDSYPNPILGKKPDLSNGYAFLSAPFSKGTEVSGFQGNFHVKINKRDADIGLVLYQMLPDGRLFELSYFTQRASFARDMRKRMLLTPGRDTAIPFARDYVFSRWFAKGSRLLLTVNVNKNPFAEIDYGTGKDVSTEDIHDAGAPLHVQWLTDSYVQLRIRR